MTGVGIRLAAGDDFVSVADGVSLPGTLRITDTGGGNDAISVSGELVLGDLRIDMGSGMDVVALTNLGGSIGSLSIDTGSNNDCVEWSDSFSSLSISTLRIDTGSGDDLLLRFEVSIGSAPTINTMNIGSGSGDDEVIVQNTNVLGAASVTAGAGSDVVSFFMVTSGSGIVDGAGGTDVFIDSGGNSGFTTTNFEAFNP